MSVLETSVPHASAAARAGLQQRIRDRLHLAALRRRPATPWNRLVLAFALIGPGLLVMLGDNDAAIAALAKSLAAPAGIVSVPQLKLDPVWDPIRNDPRFQALLKKYGGDAPTKGVP